jgi:hypothetical protein
MMLKCDICGTEINIEDDEYLIDMRVVSYYQGGMVRDRVLNTVIKCRECIILDQ